MKLYVPFQVYCYYRDTLSLTEQKDYDAIRNAIIERRQVVPINPSSNPQKLFLMVKNDRPFTFHTSLHYEISHKALYPHYGITEVEMCRIMETVIQETERVHKILQNDPTVFHKVKRIHDMLCLAVTYDPSDETNNLAGCLLHHRSACLGISHTFKFLCDREQIPSVVVWSDQKAQKPGHAWNLVQLDDGKWYGVDTTNDLGNLWNSGFCRHDHFLVSQEELGGDHIPACSEALPIIHDFNLYQKENRLTNSDMDVIQVLSKAGGEPVSFKTTRTYTPSDEHIAHIAEPYIKGNTVRFFHDQKLRIWHIKM